MSYHLLRGVTRMKRKARVAKRSKVPPDSSLRSGIESRLAEVRLEQMLAELRERAGLSQKQVALRIGTSQPWIAEAEKRPAMNMQLSTLATFVAATGGSLELVVRDATGKTIRTVGVKKTEGDAE